MALPRTERAAHAIGSVRKAHRHMSSEVLHAWLPIGTVVVILLCPGPTNTLLMAAATRSGIWRSLPLLAAELTGYLTAMLTIEALLGRYVRAAENATTALRIVAAAYLLLLSVRTWVGHKTQNRAVASWRTVLVTTLCNPKALVFAQLLLLESGPARDSFLLEFICCVPFFGTLWICAGHFVAQLGGLRVSRLTPKVTSVVLAAFSLLLVARMLSS